MGANVRSATAFVTEVADTNSSTTLLEANEGRSGASIYNSSSATLYVLLGRRLAAESSPTLTIQDSDTAATDGVALYLHLDQEHENFWIGHLEFVSPTNANGTALSESGGKYIYIADNDSAAAGGATVHALAAGAGLEALLPGTKPCLVPMYTDSSFITEDALFLYVSNLSSASTAPQLYFDEDASNAYDRILAVVVDNMDETALCYSFVTTATSAKFSVALVSGAYFELPYNFTGKVTGIWASDPGTGSAHITEFE